MKTVGEVIDLVVAQGIMTRRVVITGVGAVTPLGVGADALIDRWAAGRVRDRGRRRRAATSSTRPTSSRKEARRADRFTQFAIAAADEALDAGRLARTSCRTTPTGSAA